MSEPAGHILVVDDNRMNRLTLGRSLEQQGHTVALAEDGVQALEMLAAQPFDVVLLDIIMPGMDGYEVLERIKGDATLRAIPVIVISALDEIDSAVRCIEMGAEDYLTKPINAVFLKARLDASLRRKQLRDLEQAYLQREVQLRDSEKLATLGRLSAGLAHELNNPAAAIQRGAKQMHAAFEQHLKADLALDGAGTEQMLARLLDTVQARTDHRTDLDPLERSDRESELGSWLDDHGVGMSWEMAPELVSMGVTTETLAALHAEHDGAALEQALAWIIGSSTILSVAEEVADAAQRISAIVKSLKTYTYMDRAPVQNVDVREGLESTLVMLRSKLGRGITVRREFAEDLPRVEAYSGELNQVWTNLIDNAASAMDGEGVLTLRTYREGEWVVVEISDTGPGIPDEIRPHIFDPFFTTKAPGEGTGLGLNISHNIVTQKHQGAITVTSKPGQTTFRVKLPTALAAKTPSAP